MLLCGALIVCSFIFLNANIAIGDESAKFSKLQSQLKEFENDRQMDRQLIENLVEERKRDHQLIENILEERHKDRNEITALRTYVQHNLEQQAHNQAKRFALPGQAYGGNGVAFTVCVGVADLKHLGVHQTIMFDRSITNQSNGYHTSTGIFTAPVNGIYVFHLSTMNLPGQFQGYEIVKDGVFVDDMLTDANGNQGYESVSEMWALKLNIGSEVWIRTSSAGEVHGNCHTMFTGFLLNETEN